MLNAIALVLMVYFAVAAARISRVMGEEAAVLREYHQPQTLQVLVWLFPLGPLLLLVGPLLAPFPAPLLLCLGCFVPAIFVARNCIASLERSGTDRVKRVQAVATQVVGNGIAGLALAGAVLVLSSAARVYAPTM